MQTELAEVKLPNFELPHTEPKLPPNLYRQRIDELIIKADDLGFDHFVVYGDREHFANLAYLTGFDPRFEEALLFFNIGDKGEKPTLIVGAEGKEYSKISPIIDELDTTYYESFSLLGIVDRGQSKSLKQIFKENGINKRDTIGVAGWKHYNPSETENPNTTIEIPSFIIDNLRNITGNREDVRNANALFMDSSKGLRARNTIDQLALCEYKACYTSETIRRAISNLQPGMTELELAESMNLNGMPLSCHLMLSSGKRAFMGLPSPSMRTIELGDPLFMAYGLQGGALNCRAGFVVNGVSDLPDEISDYVDKLLSPYFKAIIAWYENVQIGVTGGELYDKVYKQIRDSMVELNFNPGHLIHLDEFVNTPIYEKSSEELLSGMALQVDLIPSSNTSYFTTNVEDGIALADEQLRAEFSKAYPQAWKRIEKRRDFIQEELGIQLNSEILPFSNIPAYLPPYLLSPDLAMKKIG